MTVKLNPISLDVMEKAKSGERTILKFMLSAEMLVFTLLCYLLRHDMTALRVFICAIAMLSVPYAALTVGGAYRELSPEKIKELDVLADSHPELQNFVKKIKVERTLRLIDMAVAKAWILDKEDEAATDEDEDSGFF